MHSHDERDKLPELAGSVLDKQLIYKIPEGTVSDPVTPNSSYFSRAERTSVYTHTSAGVCSQNAVGPVYGIDTVNAPFVADIPKIRVRFAKLSQFRTMSNLHETNADLVRGMGGKVRPSAAGLSRLADVSPVQAPGMDILNQYKYAQGLMACSSFRNHPGAGKYAITGENVELMYNVVKLSKVLTDRYRLLENAWDYVVTSSATENSNTRLDVRKVEDHFEMRDHSVARNMSRPLTHYAKQDQAKSYAIGAALTDTWLDRTWDEDTPASTVRSSAALDKHPLGDVMLSKSSEMHKLSWPVMGMDGAFNPNLYTDDAHPVEYVVNDSMSDDLGVRYLTKSAFDSFQHDITNYALNEIRGFFKGEEELNGLPEKFAGNGETPVESEEEKTYTFAATDALEYESDTSGEYQYGSEMDEDNHIYYTRPNGERYYPRKLSIAAQGTAGSDVEFVRKARDHGIPVLLFGPPGTGKSALADTALSNLVSINGTGDTETADFIGSYEQTGEDTFEWRDGPLLTAMDNGWPLLVDEIALIDSRALSVLYSVMDGRQEINVTASPSRGVVRAQDGFYVIAACNPDVPGAVMSEALLSRFSLQIEVRTDYDNLESLGIGNLTAKMARNLHKKFTDNQIVAEPQIRELLAFDKNAKIFGTEIAVGNLLSSVDENDRAEYKNVASSVFGVASKALTL